MLAVISGFVLFAICFIVAVMGEFGFWTKHLLRHEGKLAVVVLIGIVCAAVLVIYGTYP
jgi:hypothetical protein